MDVSASDSRRFDPSTSFAPRPDRGWTQGIRRPSTLVGLLLLAIVLALWLLFSWLTVTERDETLKRATFKLATSASTYAEYAIALAHVRSGGEPTFVPLDPVRDRTRLDAFRAAMPSWPGAHVSLLRKSDGAWLSGDPPDDAAAAALSSLPRGGADGRLVARADAAEADSVAIANWSVADALAEWRQGAVFEAGGLLVLSVTILGVGALLMKQLGRREAAEAALRASETGLSRERLHLARAQRVALIASYRFDLRTGRFEWSDEACRIFGRDREALPATVDELEALMPQEDLKRVRESVARAQEPIDAIPPTEYRIRHSDGSLRIVYREVERMLDSAGRPTDLLGVIRDVTELRDAERQRNELQRQLQETQKMEALGTLAGGIAHDLNNALVPILALSSLLLDNAPEGSPDRGLLALIQEGGSRARALVQQILTFARRDEPKRELLDMATVAGSVLKLLRSTLPATIVIEERMACVRPTVADEGQVHQVVMNLVTNAAHAIGDRTGTITVEVAEVSSAPPDGSGAVRLSVADTGCGMDEATRQRIFDPFFTTKPVNEGTGLGLSVVHGIVNGHKGAIAVESRPGEGTRFDVYFPVIAGNIAAEPECRIGQGALTPGSGKMAAKG
jgi:PAS domain S-box-containing protein